MPVLPWQQDDIRVGGPVNRRRLWSGAHQPARSLAGLLGRNHRTQGRKKTERGHGSIERREYLIDGPAVQT